MLRVILAIGIFLALAFSLALIPLSQTDPLREGSESVYTIQVYHDLVLVDVVVTDKKGNTIKNLTRGNFTIYEDNAPQKISTFDYEDLSTIFEQSNKATVHAQRALPLINLSKSSLEQVPREQFRHHRLIILLFDLSSMPVEDLIQAQTTAQNFIEKQLTPADLVALVVNASSLKLLQNFTNDREALRAAVTKLNVGDSTDLAQLGTTTTEENTSEDVSDAYQADETQFNIFNTDRKLSAIESVGKMFQQLPEKKFLVHFSSGISTTGVENQSQLRATIDALNQASTSLYAVDTRGLIAAPPGGDASKGSASGTANFSGKAIRDQFASIANSQETLTALALDTGGKALLDTNNLGQVFQAVLQDSTSYYLLSYNSSNTKRDGKFRRIKVSVDIPGARLKYRQGYYSPKAFNQLTKFDKERHLEEAITTERPFSEISFLIATSFVRADAQQVFVPVSLKFSAADIPFQQKGKKAQAAFDFIGQVRGARNSLVSAVRDTIRIDLKPEIFSKVSAGGIQYQTGFYLKPGEYDLKFLLRENQTGKLSTFEQALQVPDFSRPALSVSSVILSNHLEPVKQHTNAVRRVASLGEGLFPFPSRSDDPLIVEGNRIVPNVAKVFSPSDKLYIFFQVYVGSAHKGSPNLAASLVFYKDGAQFRDARTIPLDQFDEGSNDTITCHLELPLTQFAKGNYLLQLNLVDQSSQEVLTQRNPFVVR
jgi:VWFA-related protein